jgi:hypothetical protein
MAEKKWIYSITIRWAGEPYDQPDSYLVEATREAMQEIESLLADAQDAEIVDNYELGEALTAPMPAKEAMQAIEKRYLELKEEFES